MSREAGQVTARQALGGAAVLVVLLTLTVAGLNILLPPVERLAALDAPAVPAPLRCPETAALDAAASLTPESAVLLECAHRFDRRAISYTGEVVRAVLLRGDHAWVQVNDDTYALDRGPVPEIRTAEGGNAGIAVRLPAEAARVIAHVGGPHSRGDRIRVDGIFHRAHPADAGNPVLEASSVAVVEIGHPIGRPVSARRAATAGLLSLLAAAAALAARRRRRVG